MIKVGQIYKTDQNELFIVTYIRVYSADIIYQNGYTETSSKDGWLKDNKLIAEYPTWQEAVNSKEFKGGMKNER